MRSILYSKVNAVSQDKQLFAAVAQNIFFENFWQKVIKFPQRRPGDAFILSQTTMMQFFL